MSGVRKGIISPPIDQSYTPPPPPEPQRRAIIQPPIDQSYVPPAPIAPLPLAPPPVTFTSFPQSAQGQSEFRADNTALQTLGGLAAQFATPVGKSGYSKSLRPEYGRLVR